ncbi:MAG TPA: glycosyltransferase [Baekduia sp.]|nr:glycosyltransferase [Baekduia sp.]
MAAIERPLTDVPVTRLQIERFREVLTEEEYLDFEDLAERARDLLRGRVIWCVNSTAQGGGVAEMLRPLLGYTRGADIDCRWLVLQGRPDFFTITKRLHNRLHDAEGDGGPLGEGERGEYEAITGPAGATLAGFVRPGDVVLLHDPQTAGMAPALVGTGAHVVWRAHIGVDTPGDRAREGWAFLRPYLDEVDAFVFSRAAFIWEGLDGRPVHLVPPSIDAFSAKNQQLSREAVLAILRVIGLLGAGPVDEALFLRQDGTPARVDRPATILQEGPVPAGVPIVTQVSRWDRLKDPIGVVRGFVDHVHEPEDAHLVLVGPDTGAVTDDAEGAEVLEEVREAWRRLAPEVRRRVHLVTLPMDDAEENAAMVNAIQRYSAVVVQKSLAEGFGLTVAEGMWKGRPMVASSVGGIQDQVVEGETGYLVDPRDLEGFGRALTRLLCDPEHADRLGAAAQARIRSGFLENRHLTHWAQIIAGLSLRTPA